MQTKQADNRLDSQAEISRGKALGLNSAVLLTCYIRGGHRVSPLKARCLPSVWLDWLLSGRAALV